MRPAYNGWAETPQAGRVSITPTAAGVETSAAVVFDPPFRAVPIVAVTPYTSLPADVDVSFTNLTTAGMDVVLVRSGTSTTTVHWQAMGATQ